VAVEVGVADVSGAVVVPGVVAAVGFVLGDWLTAARLC